jgi:hypothetical protein
VPTLGKKNWGQAPNRRRRTERWGGVNRKPGESSGRRAVEADRNTSGAPRLFPSKDRMNCRVKWVWIAWEGR